MSEPDKVGPDSAARRQAVLDETARTYAAYVESGYAARWSGAQRGVSIAVEDRDRWVTTAIGPALAGTVVDLGSGDGALGVLLDAVGQRPHRLVGFDLLEPRVAVARSRVAWAEFHQASADDLPLADSVAEAVVAMTLFSSLTEDWFRQRVATEINRILAREGRLVVYDIRYPSPGNRRVRPIGSSDLAALFPGWGIQAQTMTLLPPLARTWLAAGPRRYGLLSAIPVLRSHLGAILIKP